MDPAQLEADIAALTSAIAEEAGGLDGASEGVPSYHGYSAARAAAHVASSRPSTELHSRSDKDGSDVGGCKVASKGLGAQYPPKYLPPFPQQSPHQSPQQCSQQSALQQPPAAAQQQVYSHTGQGAEVPMAATSRGVPRKADRHEQDHRHNQEQPSGLEDW